MSNLPEIIKYSENNNVIKRVKELLDKDASVFITSVINISRSNNALQECTPDSVWGSAIKAASLKLPIEPSLGYAYVIPYGKEAQFQIGYKGILQLAIRSGQYKKIHATGVYADELIAYNPITGELKVKDNLEDFKMRYDGKSVPVGYYAILELHSGFVAEVYMTKKDVEAHGKRFSKSYNSKSSPWQTDFDAMAEKTVLKQLLGRYGILSIDMQKAFVAEDEQKNTVIDNNTNDNIPDAGEKQESVTRGKVKKKEEAPVIEAEITEPAKEEPKQEEEKDPFDD